MTAPLARETRPSAEASPAQRRPWVAGLVLAAGESARMGAPKATMDAGGRPFAVRLVETLAKGGCVPVAVVARAAGGELARQVKAASGRIVVNSGGAGGQVGSLRAGIADLQDGVADLGAVVFTPVDNPAIAAATVEALVEAWRRTGAAIVVPCFEGRRGHPVLADIGIAGEFFEDGLAEGARAVVRRDPGRVLEVAVPDSAVLDDLDTPRRWRRRFGDGPSAADAAAAVAEAVGAGRRICTAVVTECDDDALVGLRWWRCGDQTGGTLGHRALDEAVDRVLPQVLPPGVASGAVARPVQYPVAAGPATATVYMQAHGPPPRLVVVGAGHVAVPLSRCGALLGMRVEVLDDRPEFASPKRFPEASAVRVIDFRAPFADTPLVPADHVVLVTRGHRFDYECLIRLLRMEQAPEYIGMIGSRRRVRATHEQLVRDGFDAADLRRVRAPVGLDLRGQTPAEIAVSVAAEVVMFRNGGTGMPLPDKERVVERYFGAQRRRDRVAGRDGAS